MLLDPLEWAQISLLQDRIIEPKTVELFKQLLKCGDVYLDVGAHIGFHSLVARVLVDQAGRVIAVEPQPYNCDRILNNWRVNGFDNLKLYLAVAGAGPDMVELHNQSPTDKSRLTLCLEPVNDLPQVFVVPMLTLESLIERNRVGKVKLLKIDAEGYEAEVLRGLGDSVSLVENIVLELLSYKGLSYPRTTCGRHAPEMLHCATERSEHPLSSKTMSILRRGLQCLNGLLHPLNLHLETLSLQQLEKQRVVRAEAAGWFDRPVYVLPPGFLAPPHQPLLDELPNHHGRFDSFLRTDANDVGFEFDNGYFLSPDVEILYTMVRTCRPRRIVEIGCGNSTKIIRQAIKDSNQNCEHVAIDPQPRLDISRVVDVMIQQPIEYAEAGSRVEALEAGDVLFIDTSHEVRPANDVAYIYGKLIDKVRSGVFVHIHDIFLPYEYPRSWVVDQGLKWGEQYVVHAMLMNSSNWEVLWPGHYLQRTMPGFEKHFPHWRGDRAQSLWLRRI
jgi:FkbM family methyltransferase